MPQNFDLTVSPMPVGFGLGMVSSLVTAVVGLNATTPLSKMVFVQTQDTPRNLHQFQVLTLDARQWVDEVEDPGDHISLSLIRLANGQEWSNTEWKAITNIRNLVFAAHNNLSEPSLIQVSLSGDTVVVLSVTPLTAAHGSSNAFTVGWHAPQAGHLDWIGMFATGAPNTAYQQYFFVPDFTTDGSFQFNAPAAPGTYEFRYLVANSYTSVATSPTVTVT